MSPGLTALLCVGAAFAAAVAVAAGPNESLAVPAASVSVAAGALLLVGVVERTRWPSRPPVAGPTADPARVRSSFEAGARGRNELIVLLDRLERGEGERYLSYRPPEELARLQALAPEAFRQYLGDRVSDLEGRT
jgi:hypothetical protein